MKRAKRKLKEGSRAEEARESKKFERKEDPGRKDEKRSTRRGK